MNSSVYDLIDSRVNTINFELTNYYSEFVVKQIPAHLRDSFKCAYFTEKKKELLFLEQVISLIEDEANAA